MMKFNLGVQPNIFSQQIQEPANKPSFVRRDPDQALLKDMKGQQMKVLAELSSVPESEDFK